MVISTLFADLGTADNGRNEPNLSPRARGSVATLQTLLGLRHEGGGRDRLQRGTALAQARQARAAAHNRGQGRSQAARAFDLNGSIVLVPFPADVALVHARRRWLRRTCQL